MATDSSASGYLTPVVSPSYDSSLDDILHGCIVGITGLTPALVRPRWQRQPPTQPDFDVDWAAFGITGIDPDQFMYDWHDPDGNAGAGQNVIERDELITTLTSFYGPTSTAYCERLRDGFELSQNREMLRTANVTLMQCSPLQVVPALMKETWVRRVDMSVTFRRRTQRRYNILTVVPGALGLDNELYTTIIVTP